MRRGNDYRLLQPALVMDPNRNRSLVAYDALPADIAPAYRERLGTLGRAVRVELPDGLVEGRAIDVEADGRLVVLPGLLAEALGDRTDAIVAGHRAPSVAGVLR